MNPTLKALFERFEHASDSALFSLGDAVTIAKRSRASLYRDNKAGRLPFVKVCSSTRVTAGNLRKLIGSEQVTA